MGVRDQGGAQVFFVPRSFSPVHHTTKVARHALHMPHTHNTHTTHPNTCTHKYTCNIETTHATHTLPPSTPHHHTIRFSTITHNDHTITTCTATPPSHLKHTVSITAHPKHINKGSLSKTDLSPSPQASGDKVIWTLPKEVRGCDGAYDQHSEDDKCKLHDFLRDRDYDVIHVSKESFLVS